MNFILISPFYPHNFQMFATRLKEKGIRVLGIGTEPYEQLGPNLQNDLTEYFRVQDLANKEEVAKAAAFFYWKYGKIDRVESNNEHWLELDAFLRTEFNVPGLKTQELRTIKYKSEMKKIFKEIGAPVVEGYLIRDINDLNDLLLKIAYPVVAKPDNGVGSSATYRINNDQEMKDFAEHWNKAIPYFIEEFVEDAQLCTYDGLVDGNGNIVFETSFNYAIPTLEILKANENAINYVVQKEIDPPLREIGRKIVKGFGHRERFFHVEFFRRKDGSYITLEYNGRLAGGFTIDVYNYAHSIDLYNEYANLVSGGRFTGSNRQPQYGVAIGRRDYKDYTHSIEEIKREYSDRVKMVDRVPESFTDLLGNDFFIILCNDKDEVLNVIEYVCQ